MAWIKAQLVEHYTAIVEVIGSTLVQGWIAVAVFSGFNFTIPWVVCTTAMINLVLKLTHSESVTITDEWQPLTESSDL